MPTDRSNGPILAKKNVMELKERFYITIFLDHKVEYIFVVVTELNESNMQQVLGAWAVLVVIMYEV